MSSKKVIWIVNQYASTLNTGMGGRHLYLAEELVRMGHKVNIITGSYSHLLHTPKRFKEEYYIEKIEKNFNYVWVNLPSYKNAHSKKRIINEFLFSRKIKKIVDILDDKPDIIIHSSPALISYFGAIYLSRYYKIPYVFEIRDPWPLTLTEIGGYSKKHPFVVLLQWIEDKAYKNADYAFSNFFNGVEHMVNRGMDRSKFTWIPNGVSIDELENNQPLSEYTASMLPKDKFIVGYTGTLGAANAMSYLIKAANIVKGNKNIHFVLVGSGKDKEELISQIEKLELDNFTFIDAIPKNQVQSMLKLFDICYIGWKNNSMYRLGIAANKIPEYMYSAKPVLHSFSGAGNFIEQAESGVTVEAENPYAIADGILKLYSMSSAEREMMGARGKDFVLSHLTYKKLAHKLEDTLFQV